MLTKLKEMWGAKPGPDGPVPKGKINLARRFTILLETSGQGSMSKVYRAIDNDSGQSVCLKVQIPDKNDAAASRTARVDRPSEGEIGAKIIHPSVVKTLDHGVTTHGETFIVMEYIDGHSLQYVRENHVVPTLRAKLKVLIQAAEGLAAVHEAGFLHHDINPRNYLVDRQGKVKLIDFGLSVPNTPEFRKPGNRTGALAYMAPEVIRRESIDESIDIFAFGAVAFEFLTDKLPFESTSSLTSMVQRINAEPLDPAVANPDLPVDLHRFLRKLTARRKEDRWPKMGTVAKIFRRIRATVPK